jgi:hypothetical protein
MDIHGRVELDNDQAGLLLPEHRDGGLDLDIGADGNRNCAIVIGLAAASIGAVMLASLPGVVSGVASRAPRQMAADRHSRRKWPSSNELTHARGAQPQAGPRNWVHAVLF